MKRISRLLCVVFLGCLLTGCYETRLDVLVREDGSGRMNGQLLISERMMMAIESSENTEASGSTKVSTAFDEQTLRDKLGEDSEILELEITDLEDGSRQLEFVAEFADIVTYLNKSGDRGMAPFRLMETSEGTGSVVFANQMNESPMSPELGQLYGMVKGFYFKVSVTLPVSLSSETDALALDGTTATWEFDLRDRDGLKKAMEVEDALANGEVYAHFSLDDWPEITDELVAQRPSVQPAGISQTSEESGGKLWAQVATLHLSRIHQVIPEEEMEDVMFHSGNDEELTFHILVSWVQDAKPSEYETAVLEEVITETGESLLPEKRPHSFRRDVHERTKAFTSTVKAKAPSPLAKKIRWVKGYVPVVAGVESEVVMLNDPLSFVGEGTLKNETLQQLGAVVKEVEEKSLKIEVTGEAIDSCVLVKKDGTRHNGSQSWSGSGGQYTYTYRFSERIEPEDSVEFTLRLSEKLTRVPFEARDLLLP